MAQELLSQGMEPEEVGQYFISQGMNDQEVSELLQQVLEGDQGEEEQDTEETPQKSPPKA
jgi:hypothetical protein